MYIRQIGQGKDVFSFALTSDHRKSVVHTISKSSEFDSHTNS